MSKRADLYERELARYRETLRLDTEVAQDRYGMTLIHSLSPSEKVLALKEMGNEITNAADYYNLGFVHAQDENWDEAINYFRRAIELDETRPTRSTTSASATRRPTSSRRPSPPGSTITTPSRTPS